MNKKVIAFLSLMFLFFPSLLFAETVILKSGKTVEGKIIEKTDKYLKIEVAGILISYYLDEVAGIQGNPIASVSKTKKMTKYKVTRKFYLKAMGDTYCLKFCMPLPQKDALRQRITDITTFPKINSFIKDDSGIDTPIFYFGFIKGSTSVITGVNYTVDFENEPITIKPSSIADQYTFPDKSFERYLGSDGDINIQNQLIQEKMQILTASIKNPYEKAKALYNFITDNIQYDHDLAARIMDSGSHEQRKPEETLQYGKGICYDIAKLYVSLARSAGIPSRVVRGVAFVPKEATKRYVEKIGHAWTEIYLPFYGWLTVDPTFGIAKKDAFFCFNNTSHISEEYGLANAKEFGSLEKGWAIQIRSENPSGRFPVQVDEEIEIELVSE